MMKKRVLAFLLPLLFLFTLFAGQAGAETSMFTQVGHVLSLRDGDLVYYGNTPSGPLAWRVLDADADSAGNAGVFLLSRHILQLFDLRYEDADAWCGELYEQVFSETEKAGISAVNKSESSFSAFGIDWESTLLANAHVFFLSAKELNDYADASDYTGYTADGAVGYWWLRSLSAQGEAGLVRDGNTVGSSARSASWGARPAMNLVFDRLLFAAPAEAEAAPGQLLSIAAGAADEWKLTLLDDSRAFRLGEATMREGLLSVAYSGAAVGENEYISLLVRGGDGADLSYTRLLSPETADGSVTIDTAELKLPEDGRVYLFSEHDSGDKSPNSASALCELSCRLYIDTGEEGVEIEAVEVPFGAEITLPDSIFFAQRGLEFDHWELNGVPVSDKIVLTGDTVLKAVYRQLEAASLEIDKSKLVLMLFEEQDVSAVVLPAGSEVGEILWSIEGEPLIALIDNGDGSCTVKAKQPGETVLAAHTADGSLRAEISISVIGSALRAWVRNHLVLVIFLAALLFGAALYITIKNPFKKKKRRHRRRHHHHHHHHHSESGSSSSSSSNSGSGTSSNADSGSGTGSDAGLS